MKKLLIRPVPFHDESLLSLLYRASGLNKSSIASIRDVGSRSNTLPPKIVRTNFIQKEEYDLKKLSHLLDVNEDILWNLTLTRVVYNSSPLFIRKLKYCPYCLSEGHTQYLRKIWDIIFVTVCPKHNCLLIDKCPNCKIMIRLGSFNPLMCRCGFILSSANSSTLIFDDGDMSRVIADKLSKENMERKYSSNDIFNKELCEFLNFTNFMVGLSLYRDNSPKFHDNLPLISEIRRMSIEKLHESLRLIMRLYLDWPNQNDNFLQGFTDKQINMLNESTHEDIYLDARNNQNDGKEKHIDLLSRLARLDGFENKDKYDELLSRFMLKQIDWYEEQRILNARIQLETIDPNTTIAEASTSSTNEESHSTDLKEIKKDIKFPVTPQQRRKLRRLARDLRDEMNDTSQKYVTISNTIELKRAMEFFQVYPEQFPPLLYKDTKQYMHVNLTQDEYKWIEELSLEWNLSMRKTVYRLIINKISSP
jgi:hypothetical protein